MAPFNTEPPRKSVWVPPEFLHRATAPRTILPYENTACAQAEREAAIPSTKEQQAWGTTQKIL